MPADRTFWERHGRNISGRWLEPCQGVDDLRDHHLPELLRAGAVLAPEDTVRLDGGVLDLPAQGAEPAAGLVCGVGGLGTGAIQPTPRLPVVARRDAEAPIVGVLVVRGVDVALHEDFGAFQVDFEPEGDAAAFDADGLRGVDLVRGDLVLEPVAGEEPVDGLEEMAETDEGLKGRVHEDSSPCSRGGEKQHYSAGRHLSRVTVGPFRFFQLPPN